MSIAASQPLTTLPFTIASDSQDRASWLQERKKTIGASESAAVLGCSPWSSLLEMWAIKTGRSEGPDLDSQEFIFWGNELEDSIIRGYAKRTQRTTVSFGLGLRSTRWPWLSATPDALVTDDPRAAANATALLASLFSIRHLMSNGRSPEAHMGRLAELTRGWWPLQTKNIGFGSAEHWTDGVPLYYRVQCAHEALVFGANRTTGAALIAGQKLAWDDVDVDVNGLLERQIVNLTRLFMRQHIELDQEPSADASESARRTISALYPLHKPEKTIALGGELMDMADVCDRQKAERKQLDESIKGFENVIRLEMQDAERAVFPDGSGFTFKASRTGARTLLRKQAKGE